MLPARIEGQHHHQPNSFLEKNRTSIADGSIKTPLAMTTHPLAGPQTPGLHLLYVPSVVALITFQGYFSQYLFNISPDLRPGPLTFRENLIFNGLLVCLWWAYYKACTIDPGRFVFSPSSNNKDNDNDKKPKSPPNKRFCKKCQSFKPPRAHHCRHCARCIPRMDHHCPWTNNCVSLTTFPYFLRFLLYTNIALLYLSQLLYTRLTYIWSDRHLPSYLGPSLSSLISITLLCLANFGTFFALLILLVTTIKSWVMNTTLIEQWELDRHSSLISKISSSSSNDYWTDDFDPASLSRIEFPYDLGFFKNMSQAMGTANPLMWLLPIGGGGPKLADQKRGGVGWEYEENGFNDWEGMWPPPDVEKERRVKQGGWAYKQQQQQEKEREREAEDYYYGGNGFGGGEDIKAAFERRQQEDFARRQRGQRLQQLGLQSGIVGELEEDEDEREWVGKQQPEWRNSEGDRLWDYGVDEDEEDDYVTKVEVAGEEEEDDDVPLAELIRRRKVLTKQDDDS